MQVSEKYEQKLEQGFMEMLFFTTVVQHKIKKIIWLLLTLFCASHLSFAIAATTKAQPKHQTHHALKATKKKMHATHKHKHTAKKSKKRVHAQHKPELMPTPVNHPAITSMDNVPDVRHETSLVASLQQRLIGFVHKTVDTLNYSKYKLGGTQVDTQRGVYIVDCSTYVDYILKTVYPHAFFSLVDSTGADKPTTQHYYNFFTELADDSKNYWDRIDEVEQLRPGDILVFRNKSRMRSVGGHVMVVMNKPIRDIDSFLVRVADSAPVGHTHDTRPSHVSGIGIGTLLLKVDHSGQPFAYAWKVGSQWKRNVNFAMARPIDMR